MSGEWFLVTELLFLIAAAVGAVFSFRARATTGPPATWWFTGFLLLVAADLVLAAFVGLRYINGVGNEGIEFSTAVGAFSLLRIAGIGGLVNGVRMRTQAISSANK